MQVGIDDGLYVEFELSTQEKGRPTAPVAKASLIETTEAWPSERASQSSREAKRVFVGARGRLT
jgi:hypothetical protein